MSRETYSLTVAAAFDLASQLESDRSRAHDDLLERDRRIGRELQGLEGNPSRQILAWLSAVGGEGSPDGGFRI